MMSRGSPPKARLAPAERAALIEQAATNLFAVRGYASTSAEDIAAAAGVSKPMLYRHFESKKDMCIRLLERYREELIAAPLREFIPPTSRGDGSCSDGDAQLELMVDAWLSWVEAHGDAARFLFTPVRGDEVVELVQQDLFRRQRDSQLALLREFAPSLTEDDGEPLAEMTRAAFAAIALWRLDHPDKPRAVARRALVTLARGIVVVVNSETD